MPSGSKNPDISDIRAHDRPMRYLKSAQILEGTSEVLIDHNGEIYRLRCTSRGRLILTK